MVPWAHLSPHPERHCDQLSRFCRADGRESFSHICQVAPVCTIIQHMLPWAYPSPQPKWHLNRLSHLCTAHCRVSSRMPGHVFFPKNYPFAWGDLDTHLIRGSLGPLKYSTQMASRSVQPFLHRRPQNVPIIYNGPPFLKIAPSHQDVHLHLVHRSLGPPKS